MKKQSTLLKVLETKKHTIPPTCISENLEISISISDMRNIWKLRTTEYNKHYSEFSCNDDDNFDQDALLLFSKNKSGKMISTGRIIFDSPYGLPAEIIIKNEIDKLREQGFIVAELSKLAISEEASGLLSDYIETFYKVALQQNVDRLIFICKEKSAVIYRRLVGAKVLVSNVNYSYGTNDVFSLLEWRIKESKYHQAKKSNKGAYSTSEWNYYAWLHASVTTSFQLAVYKEARKYLSGDIVDCGCGTAKIAPLLVDRKLADNNYVKSYTGIDFSEEMVSVSRWVLGRIKQASFSIEHSKIEELNGMDGSFTSGVSIQSYYSWPDPILVLSHIYKLLAKNAIFVLVTPNQSLSLIELIKEVESELIAHPDFQDFKKYNLQLAGNAQANFVSMNELINQIQQVGFTVQTCHQNHFKGGLNFIVLKKE